MNKFRNPSGWARQKLRAAVLQRDRCCQRCAAAGRATVATEADHIVPLFLGGADKASNMQGLCSECHRIKTAEDLNNRPTHAVDSSGWPTDPSHPWNVSLPARRGPARIEGLGQRHEADQEKSHENEKVGSDPRRKK